MRDALDLYDLPFYNNSGETIPAYAIMQVDEWKDDANDRDYFRVKKPDGDGKTYIINGPLEIAAGSDGMGSRKDGILARYLSGTPAADEEWGPTSGSWYLSSSGSGLNIVGGNETIALATVTRVAFAGGSPGNVIYAQVVGAVASGDPTFTFDNAVAIVGSVPTGGTGTAQNQYAQAFSDNDWVLLFQEKSSDQWLTERGGESGSQVVYFELTQDMAYADAAKLAKPVDSSGTLDSGADAFYVVDDQRQFYGKTATGGAEGYRGFALRYIDDYAGGVPGFRIITMEGPAQWLIVDIDAAYSISGTDCNVLADQPWGRPFRNRQLPETGVVVVEDDLDVASTAAIGDRWLVAWDESEEHYIFIAPIGERYITIKGTSPGVTRGTTTFTLGSPIAVNGLLPTGTITVVNDPKLDSPSGRTIYARYNVTRGSTPQTRWDTGDGGNFVEMVRGLADWNTSDDQVLDHDGDADPHWHGTGPCTPA